MNPLLKLSLLLAVALGGPFLSSCSTPERASPDQEAGMGGSVAGEGASDGKAVVDRSKGGVASGGFDDLDEYSVVEINDPLEFMNRPVFVVNDAIYLVLVRPVSKGYVFLFPKPVRQGVDNVFENVRFPVRLVNHTLQGKFGRAGRETGKFLVNSTAGIGGILKVSDKIPVLADVPDADTGQTFAKWGIPHGTYLVLPIIGPKSLRDTVGFAGDVALNPVTWIGFAFGGGYFWGGPGWTNAVTWTNTVRQLPGQMDGYDAATQNAVDKYLSVRSGWVQLREEAKNR